MAGETPSPSAALGAKGETETEELTRAQRAIARRSAEARAIVPHLELAGEVDLSARDEGVLQAPHRLTALIVQASARALRELPYANGAYRDGRYERYARVNVGVTVAAEELYVVPTIFDADQKPLDQLEEEVDRLRERALAGELTPPELAGATFTTWLAPRRGVHAAAPVVIPPQAAALSVGHPRSIPVVRDGAVLPGVSATAVLACDHRILYGDRGAALLDRIATGLESDP